MPLMLVTLFAILPVPSPIIQVVDEHDAVVYLDRDAEPSCLPRTPVVSWCRFLALPSNQAPASLSKSNVGQLGVLFVECSPLKNLSRRPQGPRFSPKKAISSAKRTKSLPQRGSKPSQVVDWSSVTVPSDSISRNLG